VIASIIDLIIANLTREKLEEQLNTQVESTDRRQNLIPSDNASKGQYRTIRKPLKAYALQKEPKPKQDGQNAPEEHPKPLSVFGVPLLKSTYLFSKKKKKNLELNFHTNKYLIFFCLFTGKHESEEDSTEPVKKKMRVDYLLSSSALHSRLSDKTINDYLDIRKMSTKFSSSYVFSTYYFEGFEDGDRGARWKLPNLFDYQSLIIPIFQRQR
jgi:hypothetical protein